MGRSCSTGSLRHDPSDRHNDRIFLACPAAWPAEPSSAHHNEWATPTCSQLAAPSWSGRRLAVQRCLAEHQITVVLPATRVGSIHFNNSYPADFLLENLNIQINVIETAWLLGVRRLLFVETSCIYPKLPEQPIREDAARCRDRAHGWVACYRQDRRAEARRNAAPAVWLRHDQPEAYQFVRPRRKLSPREQPRPRDPNVPPVRGCGSQFLDGDPLGTDTKLLE